MKPAGRTTVIAAGTLVCVIAWLCAVIGIAGAWLDCIPNDQEYGCVTPASGWARTISFLVAAALLTLLLRLATRRLLRERER